MAPRIRFKPQYVPPPHRTYWPGINAVSRTLGAPPTKPAHIAIGVESGAPKFTPGLCYCCPGYVTKQPAIGYAKIPDLCSGIYIWRRICSECLLRARHEGKLKAVDPNAQMFIILEP